MKSCIIFAVKKDGSNDMLCTHSTESSIEFCKTLIGKAPASMILPLEGAEEVLKSLNKIITEKIVYLNKLSVISSEDILDLHGICSIYSSLSRFKPNNRNVSHFQIEVV